MLCITGVLIMYGHGHLVLSCLHRRLDGVLCRIGSEELRLLGGLIETFWYQIPLHDARDAL